MGLYPAEVSAGNTYGCSFACALLLPEFHLSKRLWVTLQIQNNSHNLLPPCSKKLESFCKVLAGFAGASMEVSPSILADGSEVKSVWNVR